MRVNHTRPGSTGFSLVEMLVVIAVIGIIATIAIPNIGRVNDSAQDARNRRNAQSIASVFMSAHAAGLNFGAGKSTKAEVIEAVIAGGTVTEGSFNGSKFQLPANVAREINDDNGAAKYLTWDADAQLLIYGQDVEPIGAGGGGENVAVSMTLPEHLAALKAAYDAVVEENVPAGENTPTLQAYLALLDSFADAYQSAASDEGFDVPSSYQTLVDTMGQHWVDSFHEHENITYQENP